MTFFSTLLLARDQHCPGVRFVCFAYLQQEPSASWSIHHQQPSEALAQLRWCCISETSSLWEHFILLKVQLKQNQILSLTATTKNYTPSCFLLIEKICIWITFQLCVFVINAITSQRYVPKSKENFLISFTILIEIRLRIVNYLMSVIWKVHIEITSQPWYLGLCSFILELV